MITSEEDSVMAARRELSIAVASSKNRMCCKCEPYMKSLILYSCMIKNKKGTGDN